MKVSISEHFTYKKILKLLLSPFLMMLFTSIYVTVDGLVISNYDCIDAFAGVNLIFPIIMIVGGAGFMFGAGGSALAAKYLGEGKKEKADQVFSNIFVCTFVFGIIASLIGFFFIEPIANWMGSISDGTSQVMIQKAIEYGRILMLGQAGFMLQNMFQNFFIVNERPALGFHFTLAAGVINMIFDFLFVGAFNMGVQGAAIATIFGYVVAGIGPVIFFYFSKNSILHIRFIRINFKDVFQGCFNGLSEFVNNIATSIVGVAFNVQLLRYIGQIGVTTFAIISSFIFFFISIFIGYSIAISPVVGFNYGAQNHKELQNVLKKSLVLVGVFSLAVGTIAIVSAKELCTIFLKDDPTLIPYATKSIRIYCISLFVGGFGMFGSSFFTALNNGPISAIISFMRTFVFELLCLFIMPLIFGGDSLWSTVIVSEFLAVVLAAIFLFANNKKYHYIK